MKHRKPLEREDYNCMRIPELSASFSVFCKQLPDKVRIILLKSCTIVAKLDVPEKGIVLSVMTGQN